MTRAEWRLGAGLAILVWCACAPPPPPRLPPPKNFSGHWKGSTSQGGAITFTISGNRITALTLEYSCAAGSGAVTIQADVPLMSTFNDWTAAAVRFPPGGASGSSDILVRLQFPSVTRANGTAEYTNHPACGTSMVTWTARR